MKIGELSRATGTNIETIRYYERIGLLPEPARTAGNYRSYGEAHRTRLAFVRHSRELGFTIEEVRSLLEEKIGQLVTLRDELSRIIGRCRGGLAADCRVIEALGDHTMCNGDHE